MNPISEHTRALCILACEEVAKRIPHGAVDCIEAIRAIPGSAVAGEAKAKKSIAELCDEGFKEVGYVEPILAAPAAQGERK